MDAIKGIVLTVLIGGPVAFAVLHIIRLGGKYFYIYIWAFMFAFQVTRPILNKIERVWETEIPRACLPTAPAKDSLMFLPLHPAATTGHTLAHCDC